MYVYRLYVNGRYMTTFASYYDLLTEREEVERTALKLCSEYRYRGVVWIERSVSHTPQVTQYADNRQLRRSISRRR
jgi:hypothetical protein